MDMQMHENPEEADSNDLSRFKNSLQELKDLRSQLHNAADYCERTFLKANEKKTVMENTKEYICRSVVAVVDHLGSVSTNLEFSLSKNVVSQADLRIDCLKQRLLACEKYAHKVAFTEVCFSEDFPRHHKHYIAPSAPNLVKSNDETRNMSTNHGIDDDLPPSLYTHPHELPSTKVTKSGTSGVDFSTVLPVRNVPPMPSRPQTPIHFQGKKLGHKERTRQSVLSNDFLFLLRRSKRAK